MITEFLIIDTETLKSFPEFNENILNKLGFKLSLFRDKNEKIPCEFKDRFVGKYKKWIKMQSKIKGNI